MGTGRTPASVLWLRFRFDIKKIVNLWQHLTELCTAIAEIPTPE
jgi:hypothetical protein